VRGTAIGYCSTKAVNMKARIGGTGSDA
jgi:hypothetical protein